jgi:dTDP-4-dehydrorhamnose reductase
MHNNMKILVIGGSGVIGYKIFKYIVEKKINAQYTYFMNKPSCDKGNHLDITKKEDTIKLITTINPDIVIHATALTNVDLCETNTTLTDTINVEGTANVIEGCQITHSKLVYISTSFVFDGRKQLYSEEDIPSPATYYGKTKYKGEELTKNSGLPYLILRTDQPYCWIEKWQHTNSVLRVIETLKSGKTLKEITDWYNTPTYVPDFVQATWKLLETKSTGTFHLVGSDSINRFNWALLIADVFNLDKKLIEPITSDVLNLPAKRANVNLSNKKLSEKTGIHMLGVKEGLIQMLNTN